LGRLDTDNPHFISNFISIRVWQSYPLLSDQRQCWTTPLSSSWPSLETLNSHWDVNSLADFLPYTKEAGTKIIVVRLLTICIWCEKDKSHHHQLLRMLVVILIILVFAYNGVAIVAISTHQQQQ